MRKAKITKCIIWLSIIAGFLLLVYAGYMFFTQLNDYLKSSDTYEDTVDEYVSVRDEKENAVETNWKDLIDVDLSKLREENEDIAGWIYFENIDISYPVLYSGDDFTYLRKNYRGESFTAGSIFMEGENNKDFSDVHTIIYGHNMKDLSMFGKLRYFASDRDYIREREYFQIITENKKYRYKIIAYKIVAEDNDIYTVYRKGGQDFRTFVDDVILAGSYYKSDDIIKYDDHIITLSTCSGDNRLVISAVKCDEAELSN